MKIIAESACNHNGDLNILLQLAFTSKQSGADFFTVQVMHVDTFCDVNYSKTTLYKQLEFTKKEWINCFDYCKLNQINLIPCVLDETSFKWCYDYGFKLMKIHGTDITNKPFLNYLQSKKDCKYILETQGATLFEMEFAIHILSDSIEALFTGYSNYPTEIEDLNLNCIETLKQYSYKTGYADHSTDTCNIPLMILSKGYDYIEKHITLSRNHRGYDWQVSLYPHEFSMMTSTLSHYTMALGVSYKYPCNNESQYRSIMYKKVMNCGHFTLKRADIGLTWIEQLIEDTTKHKIIGVSIIARLNSRRLPNKVLKPFHTKTIIEDLYSRLSVYFNTLYITTSNLPQDDLLANCFDSKHVFRGHPESVIDRLLALCIDKKLYAVFRVTGDNPFTDPSVMKEMELLMIQHDLDYVRVNGLPFGVGAELIKTSYLWKLYLDLKQECMNSEYLTWFILNDNTVKRGCINFLLEDEMSTINLSIDYQHDLEQCIDVCKQIPDFINLNLNQLIEICKTLPRIDPNKNIKLPNKDTLKLIEYLDLHTNTLYYEKKNIVIETCK